MATAYLGLDLECVSARSLNILILSIEDIKLFFVLKRKVQKRNTKTKRKQYRLQNDESP